MKTAICFFGQVKNYNDILYNSYQQYIYDPIYSLTDIDYFLVTFNNTTYYRPSTQENHSIDIDSINDFFNFRDSIILDICADYTIEIDNFVAHTLSQFGYCDSWGLETQLLTRNSIRQLYGLNQLYQKISNLKYDRYILCRPDALFEQRLDATLLSSINSVYNILIPNFNHWYGYNDRFAIVDSVGLATYCSRYQKIVNNPQSYHSESYLKQTIHQSGNSLYLFDNFRFRLLRANNQLSGTDY